MGAGDVMRKYPAENVSKIGAWKRKILDFDLRKAREKKKTMGKAEFRERLLIDLAVRKL
jgi:hypothetical protein